MADELLKNLAEYDEMEDQYLCQIFADDEEINRVEAMAIKSHIVNYGSRLYVNSLP